MDTSFELERLQNEKARLDEESRALDEKLNQLETLFKILTEKVAIQELRNDNAAKKQTINQLSTRIDMLEKRLAQLAKDNTLKEDDVEIEKPQNQESFRTNYASEGDPEQDDSTIRVMAFDNEEE